jgi:hypothetical protein
MNEGHPGRWMEFCEWFQHVCDEREFFRYFIVGAREDTFKLHDAVN